MTISAPGPQLSRDPRPWAPGSWEPGVMHLSDAILLKIVLIWIAVARGVDYLTPTARPSMVIETMRVALPLYTWGLLFLVPATVLTVGLVARIHGAVWLGHGLLAVAYLALIAAIAPEYLSRPWLDGIRGVAGIVLPLVLHAMIGVRTGWRPPRWEVAHGSA